jgi:hypothetical protein
MTAAGCKRAQSAALALAALAGCGDDPAARCATAAEGAIPAVAAAARARLGDPPGFRHLETRTAEDAAGGHLDVVMDFRTEEAGPLRRAAASVAFDCRLLELRIVE